jgi:hypothetical protein
MKKRNSSMMDNFVMATNNLKTGLDAGLGSHGFRVHAHQKHLRFPASMKMPSISNTHTVFYIDHRQEAWISHHEIKFST